MLSSCVYPTGCPNSPFSSQNETFTEKLISHHSPAQHLPPPPPLRLLIFPKVKSTIPTTVPANPSLHLACHSSDTPCTGLPQGLCTCSLCLAHSTSLRCLFRCHFIRDDVTLSEMLSPAPRSLPIPCTWLYFSLWDHMTWYMCIYLFISCFPAPLHSIVRSGRSGFWFCSLLYSQYLELSKVFLNDVRIKTGLESVA